MLGVICQVNSDIAGWYIDNSVLQRVLSFPKCYVSVLHILNQAYDRPIKQNSRLHFGLEG